MADERSSLEMGGEPDPGTGLESQSELGKRLRVIRQEVYGQHGVPMLADVLGLNSRDWLEAETQGNLAADVLLRFMVLTGAHPHWLLTGLGPVYQKRGKPLEFDS